MTAQAAPVIARLAALAVLTALGTVSYAQTYPTKPVRVVNPFSPGGSLDLVSRALANQLTYASVGVGSGTHLAGELFK